MLNGRGTQSFGVVLTQMREVLDMLKVLDIPSVTMSPPRPPGVPYYIIYKRFKNLVKGDKKIHSCE